MLDILEALADMGAKLAWKQKPGGNGSAAGTESRQTCFVVLLVTIACLAVFGLILWLAGVWGV